jgi:hypothetical protein
VQNKGMLFVLAYELFFGKNRAIKGGVMLIIHKYQFILLFYFNVGKNEEASYRKGTRLKFDV